MSAAIPPLVPSRRDRLPSMFAVRLVGIVGIVLAALLVAAIRAIAPALGVVALLLAPGLPLGLVLGWERAVERGAPSGPGPSTHRGAGRSA